LLMGEPGELPGSNDPGGDRFEEELPDRHDVCNGT
jgi:hypothetical protein